ncbi:MAG: ssDNA endodeoxyribonuclease [Claussenomyces sp. TS43310]|nr:MAG: ssDNA endodeoxyribonuclease [Claussenomyces sp. TS43310]
MSTSAAAEDGAPIFKAVSSSARQLFQLLNCIRFATKAQVQITQEGIRFAVEESRAMQGIAFIDKALFTSFNYTLPPPSDNDDPDAVSESPNFQISLPALLETLQIFGANDANSRFSRSDGSDYVSNIRPGRPSAFSNQALGMPGICRFSYSALGAPFSVILEEAGVVTTCNLHTYEPEAPEEIPFDRSEVVVKIIMQSRFLFDAIQELSGMTSASAPSARLSVIASPTAPFLTLTTTGPLGSASVEFTRSRELLETFNVAQRWRQSYKFEMVKAAAEAMRLASKVSLRGDRQGVLSLQFMVELEGGVISFVDFRFVPFLEGQDDEETDESEEDPAAEEPEEEDIYEQL